MPKAIKLIACVALFLIFNACIKRTGPTNRNQDRESKAQGFKQSETRPKKRHSFKERKNRLEAKLRKDPIDANWSAATSLKLASQFKQNVLEESVSLDMVECHSSVCRIDLSYQNAKIGNAIQDRLMFKEVFNLADCALSSPGISRKVLMSSKNIMQSLYLICPHRDQSRFASQN